MGPVGTPRAPRLAAAHLRGAFAPSALLRRKRARGRRRLLWCSWIRRHTPRRHSSARWPGSRSISTFPSASSLKSSSSRSSRSCPCSSCSSDILPASASAVSPAGRTFWRSPSEPQSPGGFAWTGLVHFDPAGRRLRLEPAAAGPGHGLHLPRAPASVSRRHPADSPHADGGVAADPRERRSSRGCSTTPRASLVTNGLGEIVATFALAAAFPNTVATLATPHWKQVGARSGYSVLERRRHHAAVASAAGSPGS